MGYMSGHAGDVLDHHGFAGEELQLLEKPFDSNRLLAGVRAALCLTLLLGEVEDQP